MHCARTILACLVTDLSIPLPCIMWMSVQLSGALISSTSWYSCFVSPIEISYKGWQKIVVRWILSFLPKGGIISWENFIIMFLEARSSVHSFCLWLDNVRICILHTSILYLLCLQCVVVSEHGISLYMYFNIFIILMLRFV